MTNDSGRIPARRIRSTSSGSSAPRREMSENAGISVRFGIEGGSRRSSQPCPLSISARPAGSLHQSRPRRVQSSDGIVSKSRDMMTARAICPSLSARRVRPITAPIESFRTTGARPGRQASTDRYEAVGDARTPSNAWHPCARAWRTCEAGRCGWSSSGTRSRGGWWPNAATKLASSGPYTPRPPAGKPYDILRPDGLMLRPIALADRVAAPVDRHVRRVVDQALVDGLFVVQPAARCRVEAVDRHDSEPGAIQLSHTGHDLPIQIEVVNRLHAGRPNADGRVGMLVTNQPVHGR